MSSNPKKSLDTPKYRFQEKRLPRKPYRPAIPSNTKINGQSLICVYSILFQIFGSISALYYFLEYSNNLKPSITVNVWNLNSCSDELLLLYGSYCMNHTVLTVSTWLSRSKGYSSNPLIPFRIVWERTCSILHDLFICFYFTWTLCQYATDTLTIRLRDFMFFVTRFIASNA